MRCSLRFLNSCSSSSVIVISFQQEEVALDAAQNHALDAIKIIKSILRGLGDRAQKRLARILAQHTQQLPQRESDHLAALTLQGLYIGRDLWRQVEDCFFVRRRIATLWPLATWRPVFTQRHALIGSEKPRVRNHAAGVEFDLDLLARFAHLHTAANESSRNRVAIGMQRHVV